MLYNPVEFRSLVEILLSLPELFFVLNFPTLAKIKSSSVSGPRKLSKFMLEGVIVIDPSNSGPMPAKKDLKPSSAPVIVLPFCLTNSGIFSLCFFVPMTSQVHHILKIR